MEYKITNTQLRHADIFVLVLGALYNEISTWYHQQGANMDRWSYNEITKLIQEIKVDWYNVTHTISNNEYTDPICFAAGFTIKDKLIKFRDLITKRIDLPKISAPILSQRDYEIHEDYLKDVIDVAF